MCERRETDQWKGRAKGSRGRERGNGKGNGERRSTDLCGITSSPLLASLFEVDAGWVGLSVTVHFSPTNKQTEII
jgi:hypothetical protein